MSQTESSPTPERDTELEGVTAEEVYAEHGDYVEEFAERDDALGAIARAVITVATEEDTDDE